MTFNGNPSNRRQPTTIVNPIAWGHSRPSMASRCPDSLLVLALLIGSSTAAVRAPPGGRISVGDALQGGGRRALVDEDGRERLFHGTNIVYKGSPYYPPSGPTNSDTSLSDADMDQLKSWGFNHVRLGLMWAGAEPTRGTIDAAYLDQLRNITERLVRPNPAQPSPVLTVDSCVSPCVWLGTAWDLCVSRAAPGFDPPQECIFTVWATGRVRRAFLW